MNSDFKAFCIVAAQAIVELPYVGVQAVLYCAITYWMVSCSPSWHNCTVQALLVLPLASLLCCGRDLTVHRHTHQTNNNHRASPAPPALCSP